MQMELRLPCPCATSTMVHRPQGPTACNCTSPEMTATIHPDIGNAFVRCSLMKCAHPYLYAAMKPICICCQTSSACASQSSNTMFGLNRSSAMQFSINGKKADMYIDMYMSKNFICICVISPCISSIHVSVQSSYNPLTWCLMNSSFLWPQSTMISNGKVKDNISTYLRLLHWNAGKPVPLLSFWHILVS